MSTVFTTLPLSCFTKREAGVMANPVWSEILKKVPLVELKQVCLSGCLSTAYLTCV